MSGRVTTDERLMPDTVLVLGIPLFARDIPAAVELVLRACLQGEVSEPRCISATGAHGLVTAQRDPEFRRILQRFYLNLPDGKPVVWVGRLKGAHTMRRCYGPDFFAALLEASAALPVRHYFCGGKLGVAEQLKKVVAEKFGNRQVVGTYAPPFRPLTDEEFQVLASDIDAREADIVWIGISTPKQERFAATLARYTRRARYIVTVGAAFDFHIGAVRQAPKWIQEAGLEWFFRLLMEPRRLWRRYVDVVPSFLYYNLKEYFLHLLSRKTSHITRR
jgi:N-acetylglucosaminyldiphosphoundecaprenol N-acetyl-beta-D-mannosaminyltransferase